MKSKRYQDRRLRLIAASVVGDKVLDIGHAVMPNPYLRQFDCAGYDLVKSDHSDTGYTEEIQGDVRDIRVKLNNREFDSIICGELIEHLEDPYQFLRDIRVLLKSEGRLILSTPNPLGFPILFCEVFWIKRFFYTEAHTYCFLPRWMERLLDSSGYWLLQTKSVGFWLPFAVLPYCPAVLSYQVVYIAQKNRER